MNLCRAQHWNKTINQHREYPNSICFAWVGSQSKLLLTKLISMDRSGTPVCATALHHVWGRALRRRREDMPHQYGQLAATCMTECNTFAEGSIVVFAFKDGGQIAAIFIEGHDEIITILSTFWSVWWSNSIVFHGFCRTFGVFLEFHNRDAFQSSLWSARQNSPQMKFVTMVKKKKKCRERKQSFSLRNMSYLY